MEAGYRATLGSTGRTACAGVTDAREVSLVLAIALLAFPVGLDRRMGTSTTKLYSRCRLDAEVEARDGAGDALADGTCLLDCVLSSVDGNGGGGMAEGIRD